MRNELLNDVIDKWRAIPKNNQWIDHCNRQKSFYDAVNVAALAIDENKKKHPHQWMIKNEVLSGFAEKLLTRTDDLEKSESFNELHSIVCECSIKGIGELAIYDTAFRIGMHRNIKPQCVYLHRGARIGAKNLFGDKINTKAIVKEDFPEPFQKLECFEIENILCNRKHDLKSINDQ